MTSGSGMPRPATLRALTGLRALAALWVVAHHLRAPLASLVPDSLAWRNFLYSGHLGVDIFAVLSGFVIALNYAERLGRPDGTSRRRFVWLRAARILPLHWFTLIVMALEVPLLDMQGRNAATFSAGEFLFHASMTHGWGFAQDFAWNVPSWTVSTEWLCYLVFAAAGPLLMRLRSGAAAFAGAFVLLALTAFALVHLMLNAPTNVLRFAPLRIGGEFAAGCLLFVAWRRSFGKHWNWPLISLVSVLGLTAAAALDAPLGAITCAGLMVYSLAHERGPVAGLLASRACFYWGEASYSIYLVHWPVIRAFHTVMPGTLRSVEPAERAALIALQVAVILAISALTHRFVEVPTRRYLRHRVRDPHES